VRIQASRIIEVGSYVLEDGYYSVHWGEGATAGLISGKILNVWKREGDSLLLYRQMTVHD
jgi:hypothetical protein